MKSAKSVVDFLEQHSEWDTELYFLCSGIEDTELQASIKWGVPTYTYKIPLQVEVFMKIYDLRVVTKEN